MVILHMRHVCLVNDDTIFILEQWTRLCSCRYFNSLQSECFSACFHSDVNMVISAPTGSGKTVLFELCILRLLSKFISAEGKFIHVKGTLKTVGFYPNFPPVNAWLLGILMNWNISSTSNFKFTAIRAQSV